MKRFQAGLRAQKPRDDLVMKGPRFESGRRLRGRHSAGATPELPAPPSEQ